MNDSGAFFGILVIVAVIAAAIYGGYEFFNNYTSLSHKEVSGTVDYSDCRQQITLEKDQYNAQGGTFVCNDEKTNSGKSMGGECVEVALDSSGKCQTAYIYEKPADETCEANSYLTVNDKCQCDDGYVQSGTSCITEDQSCQNQLGADSYDSFDSGCTCDAGYVLSGGQCVTQDQSCQNSLGPNSNFDGYSCACNTGYVMNADQTACIQETNTQKCQDENGPNSDWSGTVCGCASGYAWNSGHTACIDSADATCQSSYGSNSMATGQTGSNGGPICGCSPGYGWNSESGTGATACVDSSQFNQVCQSSDGVGAESTGNTDSGGYPTCQCMYGYTASGNTCVAGY